MLERVKNYIKKNRKYVIFLAVAAVLAGINFGISAWLQGAPWVAETTFVPIAKGVSSVLRFVVNWLPFSMVELCVGLLILLLIFIVVMSVAALISLIRKKRKKRHGAAAEQEEADEEERGSFLRTVGSVALALAILFSYFNLSYGFVFNRPEIDVLMGLEKKPHTVEQLYELTALLAKRAGETRAELPEGVNPASFDFDFGEIRDNAISAFEKLQQSEGGELFEGFLTRPKEVFFGQWMSYLGIAGMYAPFFSESSISCDGTMVSIPYTVTHELAHSVMFGREDEANFVAFLACTGSDDPLTRYSGYYRAYSYCANALYLADEELYLQMLENAPREVLLDRKIESDHVRSYQGATVEIAQKYNDAFIKSTGQEHGIESYGRVVELFLAYQDKYGIS